MSRFDVVIVGAGMAGASLAAEIAPRASVLLIEAEDQPGYHSTGRSAAFWDETYGGPVIQPLTTASGPWLSERGFLAARGALYIGRDGEAALVNSFAADFGNKVALKRLDRAALAGVVPGLRDDWVHGVWEESCADIDVAGLHAFYLKAARGAEVELIVSHRLRSVERVGDVWRIAMDGRAIEATTLVNAAGAWADEIAAIVGAPPVGIRPYRRTIAKLAVDPPPPSELPLVIGIDGSFYFKPDAGGRLWLSPHDETPTQPCDAAPEELDIAIAIDRMQSVVDWRVLRVEHKWAGLRSFSPDRLPVYGFDPLSPGLFWCAGQGGFGIQTAPAAAKLAAALLLDRAPDPMVAGIDPAPYLIDRFTKDRQ
jgi:D-arginine dehydrogenase